MDRCKFESHPEPCKNYGTGKMCADCPGRKGYLTKGQLEQMFYAELEMRVLGGLGCLPKYTK